MNKSWSSCVHFLDTAHRPVANPAGAPWVTGPTPWVFMWRRSWKGRRTAGTLSKRCVWASLSLVLRVDSLEMNDDCKWRCWCGTISRMATECASCVGDERGVTGDGGGRWDFATAGLSAIHLVHIALSDCCRHRNLLEAATLETPGKPVLLFVAALGCHPRLLLPCLPCFSAAVAGVRRR